MKFKPLIVCSFVMFGLYASQASGQGLLRKLKQHTEQKVLKKTDEVIDDALFGDKEDDQNNSANGNNSGYGMPGTPGSTSGSGNTRGSGLVTEAPDVMKNINEAEEAFDAKNFSSAKYAARQAMMGIEMEIGHKILDGLPESVSGLSKVDGEDRVSSMSYGFVGLMLERLYKKNDQELHVSIGNNSALLSAANLMLSTGAYSTTDDNQNYKQTTFKGNRAVLEYDDNSGYTLSVPFGQSSIFILNGINFESETEIMSAAENFDIEPIKKELGEQ